MGTKKSMAMVCAAMLASAGLSAQAATFHVDLTGWVATGDFADVGNSFAWVEVGAGQTVTGFSYTNLKFATDVAGDSWLSELVLSVNRDDATAWLDWAPSTMNAAGAMGPIDGAFGGSEGAEGPYIPNGPFVTASGTLYVTSYLSWSAPPAGIAIESGMLHIQVVPEPGTYGLMALGLLAVGTVVRRRQG